jgi:hypothetical protein
LVCNICWLRALGVEYHRRAVQDLLGGDEKVCRREMYGC